MNSPCEMQCFTMYKFQPQRIILINNKSKKLYCYGQRERQINFKINNQIILKAQPFCSGLIYELQATNLRKQLQPKINGSNKQQFGQQQLNNTFQPIISYLQQGNKHNGITLDTILVDNQGNIKLKDPQITKIVQNKSDYECLGSVILQCVTLKSQQQVSKIPKTKQSFVNILKKFSCKFISNIWILFNNQEKLLNYVSMNSQPTQVLQYQALIDQIQKLKTDGLNNSIKNNLLKQKKLTIATGPNPITNLKFNKAKKNEQHIDSVIKKKLQNQNQFENENERQQNTNMGGKNTDALQKLFMSKCQINKDVNNTQQKRNANQKKKPSLIINFYHPQLKIKQKVNEKQFNGNKRTIQNLKQGLSSEKTK